MVAARARRTLGAAVWLLSVPPACATSESRQEDQAASEVSSSKHSSQPVGRASSISQKATEKLPKVLGDSVVWVRSTDAERRMRCQGVALGNARVLTAKHCVFARVDVSLRPAERWIHVSMSEAHPSLDIAVLDLAETLPLVHFPRLTDQCAMRRPLISACFAGRGAETSELQETRVEFFCSSHDDCFSAELELPPGASGCPLFHVATGTLAALGVASRKEASRTVCVTKSLVDEMVGSRRGQE